MLKLKASQSEALMGIVGWAAKHLRVPNIETNDVKDLPGFSLIVMEKLRPKLESSSQRKKVREEMRASKASRRSNRFLKEAETLAKMWPEIHQQPDIGGAHFTRSSAASL